MLDNFFVSLNNVLREFNEMKKEIKNPENFRHFITIVDISRETYERKGIEISAYLTRDRPAVIYKYILEGHCLSF